MVRLSLNTLNHLTILLFKVHVLNLSVRSYVGMKDGNMYVNFL